ncbi:hypothetical protein CSIM01_13872 [Colletotrichum simmondsii]|uniref:Uncharacterized protein n=1 Tax=Colletotrichum simmondsii TaxID=703756 RepID=A0A135SSA7_9PEZI|nr:hypothetical protein CSIM01_13872 [Colletotrichum simmondsii]
MASSSSTASKASMAPPSYFASNDLDFNPWDALDIEITDPKIIRSDKFQDIVDKHYIRAVAHCDPADRIGYPQAFPWGVKLHGGQSTGPGLAPGTQGGPSGVTPGRSGNPFVAGDNSPEAGRRQETSPGRPEKPKILDDDHEDAILQDPEAVIVIDEPRRGYPRVTDKNLLLAGCIVGWPRNKMHIDIDHRNIVLAKFTRTGYFYKKVLNYNSKTKPVGWEYALSSPEIRTNDIVFNDQFKCCMSEETEVGKFDKLRTMVIHAVQNDRGRNPNVFSAVP